MTAIEEAYAVWNRRVPTAALNRWFEQAVDANPPPAVSGRRLKLNYITQAKARPPSFILFCSRADAVPKSYLRYLVNTMREFFELPGTPVRISLREKENPFAHKRRAAFMSEHAANGVVETPPARGAAVIFIFVTILLDTLALGVVIPILPKLIESFVNNDTANAARIFGLFGTAWALMQFFFSPILGGLSDRFGRRPVVLLSNFGLAADYVLMALAPSLIWLFVGRVISGITSASISTAFAYIADVTPPEQRAAVFGKIGVAFGAGFILGPALGGLLGGIDPRLPFWVAAGLSFANALYGLLILPESLPPERRSPFRWKSANPVGALHLLRSEPRAGRPVAGEFLRPARACGAALRPSCSTRPIAMAGMRPRSALRWRWSVSAQWRCRACHRSDRQAVRRAPRADVRPRLRRGRLLDLRRGAKRAAVLGRHSRDGVVGHRGSGDAGADHAAGRSRSAGPVAGRDHQRAERLATGRAVSVHADIRLFHRRERAVEIAGRAVLAGVGAVAAGAGDRGTHAFDRESPLDPLLPKALQSVAGTE